MQLSLDMKLALLIILFLARISRSWAFDSRLSIGTALDTAEFTMRTEFPASVGEQLHISQFPFHIYGKQIDQIKVGVV